MEFDYKNPPKDCCPNVLCGQKKEDCCWVTKVVIAAAMGDDSEDSKVKPEPGAYVNALVEYEANGAIYFYTSDGIPTRLGTSQKGAEAASIEYVDSQDRKILKSAKDFANAGDVATLQLATQQAQVREAQVLQDAKDYADSKDATTLQSARDYADGKDATTLSSANTYADGVAAQALADAKAYTDSAASSVVTRNYVDMGDQNTLDTATQRINAAKGEVEGEISDLEDSLATVATTGNYSDLLNAPSIPVIDMVPSADDPGEGVALAANHFIGVYN